MSESQITMQLVMPLLLAMCSGALVRITLTFVRQRWASTYHHTMSYILLPLITFIITKVISGNIVLSLGMIGALSIVRFRNPVKNSFELVIFFALITIGISMSVQVMYGVLLTAGIVSTIVAAYYLEKIATRYNISLFSLSFDEGQLHNILEVTSKEKIPALAESKALSQSVFDLSNSEYIYRLTFSSKEEMKEICENIVDLKSISLIDARYV